MQRTRPECQSRALLEELADAFKPYDTESLCERLTGAGVVAAAIRSFDEVHHAQRRLRRLVRQHADTDFKIVLYAISAVQDRRTTLTGNCIAGHWRAHRRDLVAYTRKGYPMKKPLFAFISLMAVATIALGEAKNFPSQPVKVLVSTSPGTSADSLARYFGQELAGTLGQPVVVENRPGGDV